MLDDYSKVTTKSSNLAIQIINTLLSNYPNWCEVEHVQLLLGTCAVESNLGYYRKQTNGPARGIFQIEPTTAVDLIDRVVFVKYKKLYSHITTECPFYSKENISTKKQLIGDLLITDDKLSILLARIKYLGDKRATPKDLVGIAETWKRVYNTYKGKGTINKYIEKYNRYVGDFDQMNKYIADFILDS